MQWKKTRDTIEKYILLKCFIAGWDFNSCFMIRALNSQLVPGIPHHLYQQHHHQHYHRDWADWRLAMSGNLPIAIHWSQIWRKKKHNKRKKERREVEFARMIKVKKIWGKGRRKRQKEGLGVGFAYGFVLVRWWAMSGGSKWHANDVWAGGSWWRWQCWRICE